jgi:hypothetical protein
MDFRTELFPDKPHLPITHHNSLMFIGSCFSQNIGQAFADGGFSTLINPFGIVFNPISVANTLNCLLSDNSFKDSDLINHNGLWYSWHHHGSFSNTSKENLLSRINNERNEARAFLKHTSFLFITFGTAWVFKHIETNQIVANCHKVPANQFERFRLNINGIIQQWLPLIDKLKKVNSELQIVFTVSPVRHLADGAHGNQLSKSTLLLAIDEICSQTGATYYPAYELLLDDLRDYRFYDADLVHPSATAVAYIREKIFSGWLSPQTLQIADEVVKLKKAAHHRPLGNNKESAKAFKQSVLERILNLKEKHPEVCLDDLLNEIEKNI